MINNNPLYRYSLLEAKRNNELDLWRESQKANEECKQAIEVAIASNFDGMHLMKDTAKEVIKNYGFDRVNWVLANTIQHKDYDGRFSASNKEWAKGFFIPKGQASDNTIYYIVNSHSAILDGFINQARKEYENLKLFDFSHCNDKTKVDLENKILVIDPSILKDEFKSPDFQLFYATGGFGCNHDASGRKVYGFFLKDGEETQYNRSDFIGILKEEFYPDWLTEKLEEMSQSTEEQGMNMS